MKKFFYSIITDENKTLLAGLLKLFLLVFSWLYRFVLLIVFLGYSIGILQRQKLGKPVISVGNITLGGVGKTPLVEYIARLLKERNLKPVILSRGYMINKDAALKIHESDEALMLSQTLKDVPVIVGKDRVKNAREYLKDHTADVFILDDGFQHGKMFRDLDIVAVDVTNPFGNGCLIPRGILREPVSALKRADVIVLTKTDLNSSNVFSVRQQIQQLGSSKLTFESIHKPVIFEDLRTSEHLALDTLKGKRVCSLCSIARPQTFTETLRSIGIKSDKQFFYMDHHVYTNKEIKEINQYCQDQKIEALVTTQKDAVKLVHGMPLFDSSVRLLSLRITLEIIQGKEQFVERIASISRV